jgi:hypothetical protein
MMFDREDMDYFRDRAEAELAMARSALHPDVARSHFHLAGLYLDRAYNPAMVAAAAEAPNVRNESAAAAGRTRQQESDVSAESSQQNRI